MNMFKEIFEWIISIIIALIIAFFIKCFLVNPTVVKHLSMYPTFEENQRLILNRTFRITGKEPKVGDIVTFEAPTRAYSISDVDQENPIAIYSNEVKGIVNKFFYYIVESTKTSYIKRVVAVAGDHVEIKDGKVYINGEVLKEDYLNINVKTESSVFNDFVVPEGYFFALGDNREKSTDCRILGCIPLEKLEGIVILRFWPFDKITTY